MRDPLSILCVAEKAAESIIGSATVCCITIDGDTLHAANLGDSTFIIIRQGKLVFKSDGKKSNILVSLLTPAELQHEFNFPYQIGTHGDGLDKTEEIEFQIQRGDMILVGSDGLFDNLFLDEILKMSQEDTIYHSRASYIASAAFRASNLAEKMVPHGERAAEAGLYHSGGKPDDITVIIATIS